MKKSIISIIFFLGLIIIFGYNLISSKNKIEHFINLNKKIDIVRQLNKNFDLFLTHGLHYNNFDKIEYSIFLFDKQFIEFEIGLIKSNLEDERLDSFLRLLKKDSKTKQKLLQDAKSVSAILNNSFRFIQKLKQNIKIKKFDDIYTKLLTIELDDNFDIDEQLNIITNMRYENNIQRLFLLHSKLILHYKKDFDQIVLSIDQLNLDKKLKELSIIYEDIAHNSIENAQIFVISLFIMLVILMIIYLIYSYRIVKNRDELNRFRKTVENSDNIIVVTDKNEIITYVNNAFTKTTGYTFDEAIGQRPNILKSDKKPKEFYDDMHEKIYTGKKWSGEFINVDKYGELSYEKASITPVFNDYGEIIEFIAIKLDVTEEILARNKLKEQEDLMLQQSKMAAMGEMIANIAHQWRQPLSVISTSATGILLQRDFGLSNVEDESDTLKQINESAQHLSQTIDDFRNFFKSDKEMITIHLNDTIEKTLNLVRSKFHNSEIEVKKDICDVYVVGIESELIQVIINILNNARDALKNKNDQRRLIFIKVYTKDDSAILTIKDNAGGIPKDIIHKIFDPYFTTKHQSQGTGIGLHMSQEIITKHMSGTIGVKNESYEYEDEFYTGAEFKIVLSTEI